MTHTIEYADLADKIVALVPEHTWSVVKEKVIEHLVDAMPSAVLRNLTGKPDDFDAADKILNDYYVMPDQKKDLILDALKVLGADYVTHVLDSMQLNKIQPTEEHAL